MTDVPEKNVQEIFKCGRCGHKGDFREIVERTGKCRFDFDCDIRLVAGRHRLVNQRHDALRNHALAQALPRVSLAKESPGSVKQTLGAQGIAGELPVDSPRKKGVQGIMIETSLGVNDSDRVSIFGEMTLYGVPLPQNHVDKVIKMLGIAPVGVSDVRCLEAWLIDTDTDLELVWHGNFRAPKYFIASRGYLMRRGKLKDPSSALSLSSSQHSTMSLAEAYETYSDLPFVSLTAAFHLNQIGEKLGVKPGWTLVAYSVP